MRRRPRCPAARRGEASLSSARRRIAPRRVRIALSRRADCTSVACGGVEGPPPRRPWLPELPARIDLRRSLSASCRVADGRVLLLGLADEPERAAAATASAARRRPRAAGRRVGGKRQDPPCCARWPRRRRDVVVVPCRSAKAAWDAVADARASAHREPGTRRPDRRPRRTGGVPAAGLRPRAPGAARAGGPRGGASRDPRRRCGAAAERRRRHGSPTCCRGASCCAASSRAEHIAAGGDAAHYAPVDPTGPRPPGRPVRAGRD